MKPEEYKVEPCKLGETAFETEQPYTMFCPACKLWSKIPKYRSCPKRHQLLMDQGEDVFAPIREAAQLASAQMGNTVSVKTKSNDTSSPKKQSRRGR